jgi:hypothetical protein
MSLVHCVQVSSAAPFLPCGIPPMGPAVGMRPADKWSHRLRRLRRCDLRSECRLPTSGATDYADYADATCGRNAVCRQVEPQITQITQMRPAVGMPSADKWSHRLRRLRRCDLRSECRLPTSGATDYADYADATCGRNAACRPLEPNCLATANSQIFFAVSIVLVACQRPTMQHRRNRRNLWP